MPENSRKVRDVRKEAEVFGRKVHKANKEMGGKLMNLGARAARPRWWEESGWKVGGKSNCGDEISVGRKVWA